jgi:hypothetical protein
MSDNPPATPEGPTEPIAPESVPAGTAEQSAPQAAPPKRNWWKIALIVVLALIGLAVLATALGDDEADPSPSEPDTVPPSSSASVAQSAAPPESVAPSVATPGFADISLSGTGDSVPTFEIPEDQPAIAVVSHTGSSNFAIVSLADDGSENDLLVNVIGNYAGTVLFDEDDGVHSVAFEITADGAWTIVISPITSARAWDGTAPLTGAGDDVILVEPAFTGLTTAAISHDGTSNFAILSYDLSGGRELLVNEIGPYSGEIAIPNDTFLIEVNADGSWSLTPS